MCFDSQQEIGELLKKERAIQGIIAKFCGRPLGNKAEKKARSTGGKEYACNAGPRFHPWVGRSPGEENGNPLQYSCLENSKNWIVHGVATSQTQLSDFRFHSFM